MLSERVCRVSGRVELLGVLSECRYDALGGGLIKVC